MADSIDFYFDFSSPYGYFASQRIDGIARKHGRDVAWHPFLLGVVFRVTGQSPLPEQPMRGDYALPDHDIFRCTDVVRSFRTCMQVVNLVQQ